MTWMAALGLGKEILALSARLFGGDKKETAAGLALGLGAKIRGKLDRADDLIGDRQMIPASEVRLWLDGGEDWVIDAAQIAAVLGVKDEDLPDLTVGGSR